MPFLSRLKAQAQNIAARAKIIFGRLFRRAADGSAELRTRIQPAAKGLVERIPQEKRQMVLIAAVGAVAVLVLLIVGVSLLSTGRSGGRGTPPPPPAASPRVSIPPDELFLPFEPDFVPGVILGRERRTEWTAEDVEPFWQDPLRGGEQQWRDMIEKTIDDIMGSVP